MHSNGPRQSDRKLCKCAQFFFLYFFLFFVVCITYVAPRLWLDIHLITIVCKDVDNLLIKVKTHDGAYGTIHPTLIEVVLHKDDLRPRLQHQLQRSG